MFARNRSARKRGRRPFPVRPGPLLEPLEPRLVPSVDVTGYHYDTASTGLNPNEVGLSPANVKVGSFGKEFTTPVDGQVYAQPLIVNNVAIAGGPNTIAGAAGTHNVVFVATENDSLYAIDQTSGAVLWERSFLDPGADDALPGASSVTAVPVADGLSTDINPVIGITGTPVIDANTNTLYLVAKTKETVGGVAHYVQRLHAINLADGTDVAAPYVIGDTTGENDNNTQIYVYGTGDGAVPDPYTNTGKQVVQFNALRENERAALSLVNGNVYVTWASHGDASPYHGWVVSWDVSRLATQGFRLDGVFNATPNNGLGGIWMGGGQLAFEPDGSAFYFMSGNGDGSPVTVGADGLPVGGDYSEAVVKVVADPTTSPANQNVNGWGLKAIDFFIPYNQPALDRVDADFGSGAPMLLPASAGIPGHPNLMVVAGKEGEIYVLDRDHLGGFDPNNDHVLNAVPDGSGHNTPPQAVSGVLNSPAYFDGSLYYLPGYGGGAQAFSLGANGTLTATSQTAVFDWGYLPGSPIVSADGTSDGIVWMIDRQTNALRAYDAASLATELWDSNQKAGGADQLGAAVKFATPVEANGEVFVGTADSLVVYGLTPPSNGVPLAPKNLTATALSGTSARLSWADPTVPPNTASVYLVEESSDGGKTFAQVTTAPAGSTSADVGGLLPGGTYVFRIRGQNGVGDSPYSIIAAVTTSNGGTQPPLAPSGLGAVPASAASVALSWTDKSANQTGFQLDRATDAAFTQNLITQSLPASPTSFTDSATGLAPGGTYYYRLRAVNSAGASANSNSASVTIPLAPAKPTNAQVTGVTSSEIDLSWTDNAGATASGYEVLRALNHGTFSLYATLPPNRGAAPGTYTWSDTGVLPGTYYDYHIEAVNVSGENDFTGANATTLTAAPGGLTATSAAGSVSLGWSAVAGAVTYNVYRGTSPGGEGAAPFATGLTTPYYVDSAVSPGQTYYYRVTAVNGNAAPLPGESAASAEVSAVPSFPPPPPPPPPATPHPTFVSTPEPFFGLILRAETPDGQLVGPNLFLPFPFAFFAHVDRVTPDSAGGATVTLDILFIRGLSLRYNSLGFLTGIAL